MRTKYGTDRPPLIPHKPLTFLCVCGWAHQSPRVGTWVTPKLWFRSAVCLSTEHVACCQITSISEWQAWPIDVYVLYSVCLSKQADNGGIKINFSQDRSTFLTCGVAALWKGIISIRQLSPHLSFWYFFAIDVLISWFWRWWKHCLSVVRIAKSCFHLEIICLTLWNTAIVWILSWLLTLLVTLFNSIIWFFFQS